MNEKDKAMTLGERIRYSENLRRPDKAASYNTKYERELHKRISMRREKKLLDRILKVAGRQDRLLDVPAGTGRLSEVLSRHCGRMVEVDYSPEMLKLCCRNAGDWSPLLAVASALRLPFADRAFDLVVSVRLSHHIPEREGRCNHLRELCRASRRHVLVTFFGEESIKAKLRRLRLRLGSRKREKYALSRGEVRRLAEECGFRVVRFWHLSRFFSGHLFALLERR